jgi:hypothetical protein
MKTSALIITLALALLAAPSAGAKEPVKATVCGASACHTETDKAALMALSEGGPPSDPPRHASPWYRSTITIGGAQGEEGKWSVVILPAERLIGTRQTLGRRLTWLPMTPAGWRAYRSLTRGLAPHPAETLTGFSSEPIPAQVDETVTPPADHGGGGIDAWTWLLTGAVALSVALAWWFRRGRARRAARGGGPLPQ